MPLNQLAFLSKWFVLRMAKRNGATVILVRKNSIPIPPGIRPEVEFSGNENGIPNRC